MDIEAKNLSKSVIKNNKQKYENYRYRNIKMINDKKSIDIKIMELLDKLGFSMEEDGTYLYNELIREVYEKIGHDETDRSFGLIRELKDKYSNFYTSIARDWLEMNPDDFIDSIEDSVSKIDYTVVDEKLFNRIYNYNYPVDNFGYLAYKIANYIKFIEDKNNRNVIGRFNATTYDDKDINFIVYDNDTIDCLDLGKEEIKRVILKPRFELIKEDNIYTYGSVHDSKSEPYFGLVKEYDIEEDLFDYLKSHGMIMYSTEMAYLYDFKDKKGYDAKDKSRAFKWTKKEKIMKKQKEGRFNY